MELTQEEIIIGTEVIGEFMDSLTVDMHGNIKEDLTSFKYHSSWDWLMPVVERIDSIIPDDSFVTIEYNRCLIMVLNGGFDIEAIGNSRIEATYKAVVEFIKWYNQQK